MKEEKDKEKKKVVPSYPKNFSIGGFMHGLDAGYYVSTVQFDEANTNSNGSPLTNLAGTHIAGDYSRRVTATIEFPSESFGMEVPATSPNGGGHVSTPFIILAELGWITAGNTWSVHYNSLGHPSAPSTRSPFFIDRSDFSSAAPVVTSVSPWNALGYAAVHITLEYREPTTIHDETPFDGGQLLLLNTNFYIQIDEQTPVKSEDILATTTTGGGLITRTLEIPVADGTKANVKFWATANATGSMYTAQQLMFYPLVPLIPPFELPPGVPLLTKSESANSNVVTVFVERSLVPGGPLNFTIS